MKEADFYRARAIDMMKKAQSAGSEITRQIYLDLAQKWTEQAESLENAALSKGPPAPPPPDKGGPAASGPSSTN
jgi:hypothetical protein